MGSTLNHGGYSFLRLTAAFAASVVLHLGAAGIATPFFSSPAAIDLAVRRTSMAMTLSAPAATDRATHGTNLIGKASSIAPANSVPRIEQTAAEAAPLSAPHSVVAGRVAGEADHPVSYYLGSGYYPVSALTRRPMQLTQPELDFANLADRYETGKIVMNVYIGPTGRVEHIKVTASQLPIEYERAARQAFSGMRFTIGERSGIPVRYYVSIELEFKPNDLTGLTGPLVPSGAGT